ncbi:MAG: rRNA maturation RNase YbeY [Alphaproteobacteria bacterium]|nr:rRNA maturation RNase YbeY [Alphaproteobacteria bacterium]
MKPAARGVEVLVEHAAWTRSLPRCRALAREAARLARGRRQGAITVVLAGDAALRRLNRDFRGKDAPTNVLAFAEGEATRPDPGRLGDVVLAHGVIAREARAQGKTLANHLAHLVVHGVLHLLGHDHGRGRDAARMEALERRLLAGLGIPDPYAPR